MHFRIQWISNREWEILQVVKDQMMISGLWIHRQRQIKYLAVKIVYAIKQEI